MLSRDLALSRAADRITLNLLRPLNNQTLVHGQSTFILYHEVGDRLDLGLPAALDQPEQPWPAPA